MSKKTRTLLKLISTLVILLVAGAGLFWGYLYVTGKYTVNTVYIEGSVHYTDEEIKNIVMSGRFGNNSLYLSYKFKNKAVKNIPFVERMDVSVIEPDTIKISVYEKALAGFIEYLGRYVYFDKDGIVCEVSTQKTYGIPEVIGVDFDYIVLYEPLPAENKDLFKSVLNITQLMTKYNVEGQKLYFDNAGNIVMYHDDIVINLGNDDNLDLKIMNLPAILENLTGMKGKLRMEKYDESTKKVTFEPDD